MKVALRFVLLNNSTGKVWPGLASVDGLLKEISIVDVKKVFLKYLSSLQPCRILSQEFAPAPLLVKIQQRKLRFCYAANELRIKGIGPESVSVLPHFQL